MENRTRRGVYIELTKSPIEYVHNGVVYKFSSQKKKDIYLKRIEESIDAINKLNGKLFRYSEILGTDYTIKDLLDGVYNKVYNNMTHK